MILSNLEKLSARLSATAELFVNIKFHMEVRRGLVRAKPLRFYLL